MEEQKYHIGIVGESHPLNGEKGYSTKTIVYYVFTMGRQLRYFLSGHRSDLGNGTLVIFALDRSDTIKIAECIPVHFNRQRKRIGTVKCIPVNLDQVYTYTNIEHGNDSLCERIFMTQEWIDKITSHPYTLFAYTDDEKKKYYIYYKHHNKNMIIEEDVHKFFTKTKDWSYEQEFRILELDACTKDSFLNIRNALIAIVLYDNSSQSVFGTTKYKLIKAISFDIPILEYSNTNLWGISLIDEDGNCNWIKAKE